MFAAVFALNGGAPPRTIASVDALIAALAPFAPPDARGAWSDEQALIVSALHYNTPNSLHEQTPEVCAVTGRIIASWGRLDNREQLCAQLGLRDREELTDPQIILAAHRAWGKDCAARLEGDFSFVIHDPERRETYCARDAMGTRPLYYAQTREHFILASSAAAIRTVEAVDAVPALEWMALFVGGFCFADDATAFDSIARLRPGHYLVVDPDGPRAPQRYFEFDLACPHAVRRDSAWVDRYREAFHKAVDRRARSHFLISAENSGGLDSASIIARLVEVLPHQRSQFYTHSLIGHQRELDLLDELADKLGLTQETREIRPDTLPTGDAIRRAHIAIGYPPEQGQPMLGAGFFEYARQQGVRTVVSGYGGDEIVTGYARFLIDELHRRGEWRAVFDEIEGTPLRRAAQFVRRLVDGPRNPAQVQANQLTAKLEASCLSREFLEDTGLHTRIERWMRPDFGSCSVNEVAALAPGFRFGRSGRLEASALFAATYGIEYRFPMYDRALIELFLSVPAIEKRRRSLGRYLHRRAVAGSIPDAIAWQPTKGLGPPLEGEFRFADQPRLEFEELPAAMRTVFDARALEHAQDLIVDPDAAPDHRVSRARFAVWQIHQLADWLRH